MVSETIQLDLADKDVGVLIERYIAEHFSDPSVKLFEELTDEIGPNDIGQWLASAGKAVLNEAMNEILIAEVKLQLEIAKNTTE